MKIIAENGVISFECKRTELEMLGRMLDIFKVGDQPLVLNFPVDFAFATMAESPVTAISEVEPVPPVESVAVPPKAPRGKVLCPECTKAFKPRGLPTHRAREHGVAGKEANQPARRARAKAARRTKRPRAPKLEPAAAEAKAEPDEEAEGDVLEKALELYSAGGTAKEVGAKLGISKERVLRVARKNGVVRPRGWKNPRPAAPEDPAEEAPSPPLEEDPAPEPPKAVRKAVEKEAGVVPMPPHVVREAIALHFAGRSAEMIGAKLRVKTLTVTSWLNEAYRRMDRDRPPGGPDPQAKRTWDDMGEEDRDNLARPILARFPA